MYLAVELRIMRKLLLMLAVLWGFACVSNAQPSEGTDYNKALQSPSMKWTCPEIGYYKEILSIKQNNDFKIYANAIKNDFKLYSIPETPEKKLIFTQAVLKAENALFDANNLIDYISNWMKNKGWGKSMNVDKKNRQILSVKTIKIADHAAFFEFFKVSGAATLMLSLVEDDKLLVTLALGNYTVDQYNNSELMGTTHANVAEVYPFVQKSSHKNTYAKAYVHTYMHFWDFIDNLCTDLNCHFSKDEKWLSNLKYKYKADSLAAKYGEVTKIIMGNPANHDIDKEIRFYEGAKKIVIMGNTIDFEDIVSCEITDDPKLILGNTTTAGVGLSFFGFDLGGTETYRTPDKTIHNYMVNIKIDNLKTPFLYIATYQNESKAKEISASFEYVMKRQSNSKKRRR